MGAYSSALETYTSTRPWLKPGPYSTPEGLYLFRLAYSAGLDLAPGAAGPYNSQWIPWIKQAIAEYREVQPYFYADFYPQVPYSLAAESWSGWQWNRPEDKDGFVELLRRPSSPFPLISLNLAKIDPGSTYRVEERSGLEKAEVRTLRGSELEHLQVQLPDAPSSLLIFYQRL